MQAHLQNLQKYKPVNISAYTIVPKVFNCLRVHILEYAAAPALHYRQ